VDALTTKGALLLLLLDGEGYGLELMERAAKKTQGRLKLHQGNVYPALRALEDGGLAASREGDPMPERGGRARRYYALTVKGRREADAHRETLRSLFDEGGLPNA
jgi:PadR family transcriptional regulator, regulatory protein PadR